MKRVRALVLAVLLTTSAFAGEGDPAQKTTGRAHRSAKAKTNQPSVSEQLEEVRALLQQQQQQIDALKAEIQQRDRAVAQAQEQAKQAQAAAAEAAETAQNAGSAVSQSNQAVTALKSDVTDLKTNLTTAAVNMQEDQKSVGEVRGEIKALSRLKFSGDLRLRFEPFFGGGVNTAPPPQNRYRERYRLRFNVNAKLNDDFSTGFSLATGDLGDPVSTNSTLTGFYTRKPIAVDKAFAVYQPHNFKNLTLTGGKFGFTWLRTELTFDSDINPEGGSESLAWNWEGKALNHFAVVAYQTPIFESGGGPDSYMLGGQVQTGWTFAPKVKFTADAAYYDFGNSDAIAQNQSISGIASNGFATQGISTGVGGNFPFSVSSQTNNVGLINGKRYFASKFGLFDVIGRLDIATGNKKWPVYALLDYVQNTQACDNLGAFVAAGATPPACDPHQRHGYWAELKAGQTRNPGDFLLGYTFARIERDAVLSAFDFSDLPQPTSVIEHRVEAAYQAYSHVQFVFTGLFGRPLVTAQQPTPYRYLKRFQFDTIVAF